MQANTAVSAATAAAVTHAVAPAADITAANNPAEAPASTPALTSQAGDSGKILSALRFVKNNVLGGFLRMDDAVSKALGASKKTRVAALVLGVAGCALGMGLTFTALGWAAPFILMGSTYAMSKSLLAMSRAEKSLQPPPQPAVARPALATIPEDAVAA